MRDDGDSRTLLVAALIGAAIGAGLGLLASQAFDEEPTMTRVVRSARKGAARRVRRGSAVASAATEAVGGFATKARDAFEDALEREVKQLRRVARRQRRRLGF